MIPYSINFTDAPQSVAVDVCQKAIESASTANGAILFALGLFSGAMIMALAAWYLDRRTRKKEVKV